MSKPRRVTVTRQPATSRYSETTEVVYNFTDGVSGGLIAFERDDADRLIVDLYNMDADVLVRTPGGGEHNWFEAPDAEELRAAKS